MSIVCHGQTLDITRIVLLLLRAHEDHCGYLRGHLRPHYARTLHAWRPGKAAFLERHAGLFQMLLVKNGSHRTFFNEPWGDAGTNSLAETARESAA
jgi:hypothetical protein